MSTEKRVNNLNTPINWLGKMGNNDLYIKREDLIPYSFGGNKARKGLLFFEEIDAGDYDCVVTYGSSHSNHCRIVANMAAKRNMPCYIIGPSEVSEETSNSDLIRLLGADFTFVPVEDVHDTIEKKLEGLKSNGHKPYFIPGGGHGNIGTQAYVECYREICEFEEEKAVHFDYIFFASGTGTTHAGLVVGQLIEEANEGVGEGRTIIGISIARKNPRGRDVVVDSIKEYVGQNPIEGLSEDDIERRTIFIDDFTGEGYGKNNDDIVGAIRSAMKEYGVPLDSTYTGKAFAGMKKYVTGEEISGKNILFIHTGGTPLFFDDLKEL